MVGSVVVEEVGPNDRNRAQNSAQNPRAMIGVSNIAMMMHFIVLAKGFVLSAS